MLSWSGIIMFLQIFSSLRWYFISSSLNLLPIWHFIVSDFPLCLYLYPSISLSLSLSLSLSHTHTHQQKPKQQSFTFFCLYLSFFLTHPQTHAIFKKAFYFRSISLSVIFQYFFLASSLELNQPITRPVRPRLSIFQRWASNFRRRPRFHLQGSPPPSHLRKKNCCSTRRKKNILNVCCTVVEHAYRITEVMDLNPTGSWDLFSLSIFSVVNL